MTSTYRKLTLTVISCMAVVVSLMLAAQPSVASELSSTANSPAPLPFGALTQLDGEKGCVSDYVATVEGCAKGRALGGPASVTVSPDGKNVYVASKQMFEDPSGAIAIFKRDPATGALTQLDGEKGCVSGRGSKHGCAVGRALRTVNSVTVSSDGKNVYVGSIGSFGGLAVFKRDPASGALTQLAGKNGCFNDDGEEGCAKARALYSALSIDVSPDGKNAYVGSSYGIVIFKRDTFTGALKQLPGKAGCVNEFGRDDCALGRHVSGLSISVSPDGGSVISAGFSFDSSIAILRRNRRTGALTQLPGSAGCINEDASSGCAKGRAIAYALSVKVSPDNKNVYVADGNFGKVMAIFSRDLATGALQQLAGRRGCVSASGIDCTLGRGTNRSRELTLSPDGRNVYVAADGGGALAAFSRGSTLGALIQLDRTAGCVNGDGSEGCAEGRGLDDGSDSVTVSPDGKNVYATSFGSDAVAVFKRETLE